MNWKCLSGSALKVIAVITMTIDHIGAFLCYDRPWFQTELATIGDKTVTPYIILRLIGRLAFPIFAFLITEGFLHTRNRKRYGISLLIFAFISEIPYSMLVANSHNIFFTLLLGYLGIYVYEYLKENRPVRLIVMIGLLAASFLTSESYGAAGFGLILLIYALREKPLLQAITGSCILPMGYTAGLAFIPINMYNGKRGFIKGNILKYLFYLYYPLHLTIIILIRRYFMCLSGNTAVL